MRQAPFRLRRIPSSACLCTGRPAFLRFVLICLTFKPSQIKRTSQASRVGRILRFMPDRRSLLLRHLVATSLISAR